jgi:integrase
VPVVWQPLVLPHVAHLPLQGLTPAMVRDALDTLGASGGRLGKPLSPRSVQYAGIVLSMALRWAVEQGMVGRNVAAAVKLPTGRAAEKKAWSPTEAGRFLNFATDDWLFCGWLLFLCRGFRRGELAGLRWDDVDLDATVDSYGKRYEPRIRVSHTRVMIDGKVADSTPKTRKSVREVPLDPTLITALRAHLLRQKVEHMAAGPVWQDTGYVLTDETGQPVQPDHLSHLWDRLVARSGLPRISLHGTRHTAATAALVAGVQTEVVSRWLGHASTAITQDTYQHVLQSQLQEAGDTVTALIAGLHHA